ncbi:MAG TPA: sulfur carrier protein ThiS [Ideonella sp.]|nr:sulfur carrier protein ThiS [Ideonella sp.]
MSPTPASSVKVNGEARPLREGVTVAELLAELQHEPSSVAVAVNGEFVPRDQRDAHVLRDGDHVACFQAIVGG